MKDISEVKDIGFIEAHRDQLHAGLTEWAAAAGPVGLTSLVSVVQGRYANAVARSDEETKIILAAAMMAIYEVAAEYCHRTLPEGEGHEPK